MKRMYGLGSEVVRLEFDEVRDKLVAHFVERTMHWVAKPHRCYKRLLLPLVSAEGPVDSLLGVITGVRV